MPKRFDSAPLSVQQVAKTFRLAGWASFWAQLVLAVVSSIILLLAGVSSRSGNTGNNPGASVGVLFAVLGILVLAASIYLDFRYVQIGRQLQNSTPSLRPKKSATVQLLQMGLVLNLSGVVVTVIGAQATIGALVLKSLTQAQVGVVTDPTRLIQPLDLFIVQGNTNTIMAQVAGVIAALWLLKSINQQRERSSDLTRRSDYGEIEEQE